MIEFSVDSNNIDRPFSASGPDCYQYWKQSNSSKDEKEIYELLSEAYVATQPALQSKHPNLVKVHNNLLYYLVDQAIRCEDKIEITSIKVKNIIKLMKSRI